MNTEDGSSPDQESRDRAPESPGTSDVENRDLATTTGGAQSAAQRLLSESHAANVQLVPSQDA